LAYTEKLGDKEIKNSQSLKEGTRTPETNAVRREKSGDPRLPKQKYNNDKRGSKTFYSLSEWGKGKCGELRGRHARPWRPELEDGRKKKKGPDHGERSLVPKPRLGRSAG